MEGNRADGTQECSSCGAHSHPRARQSTTAAPAAALLSLPLSSSLSRSRRPSYKYNCTQCARRVPTSTSFCSPHDRCEIYLDSNNAAETSTHCRAQLLRFRSISATLQKRACTFNLLSSRLLPRDLQVLRVIITDNQIYLFAPIYLLSAVS